MANLPIIGVAVDLIDRLVNGHYRHQQTMAQIDSEYRLERQRIQSQTELMHHQIDAALQYGLKQLKQQQQQEQRRFELLVKSLQLELEDSQKTHLYIQQALNMAADMSQHLEVRLMTLEKILPTLISTQQTQSDKRHALLMEGLQRPALSQMKMLKAS